MTHTDHVIRMRYTDYVICKNKKPLKAFLEFYFNAEYTNNMLGAPNKALHVVK